MIRVLMLDLGDTLIDDTDVAFPNVKDALTTISKFKTGSGDRLPMCLVSDYTMAGGTVSVDKIFKEYVGVLDGAQLTGFFQPVDHRVTLSTHAGVYKPDRKIFEKALQRLCSAAKLSECLFITENGDHIKACKKLGMKTLQFGKKADFADWAKAPDLIKALL